MVIDRLFARAGGRRFRDEANAKVVEAIIAGERVVLAKPQTFMNLSGGAVRPLLERYGGADAANLIVSSDDVALPFGMIRVRPGGSAGGQKGLKSIIERLGTDKFPRVRLGVKPDHPLGDLSGFVLSPIPKRDHEALEKMLDRAADAIEVMLAEGVVRAMSLFNERARPGVVD
jgi:PTH1 family peptidyl-tRNA hydrolase